MKQNIYCTHLQIKKGLEESIAQLAEGQLYELAGAWPDFPDRDNIQNTKAIEDSDV